MKYGEHARDTVRRCACRCDCDTEHVYNGTFVGDTPGGTVLHELRALTCTVCGGTAYVVDVPRPDLPDEDFGRVLDVRGDA
jgi:hypothetical protein